MSGLRVVIVDGVAGATARLEPDLRACVGTLELRTVATATELSDALARERWDAVVVPSDAIVDLERAAELASAHQPEVTVLTGSPEALGRSLRRLRRVLDRRGDELSRTRRELEARDEQLRHAQKMEVIGNFAGGIAHDFNNIVMSIAGYAALALQDWPRGHTGRSDIEEILRSAEQAQALTRQLLGFARKETPQPKPVDLGEVIREVHQLLRRSAGPRVDFVLRVQPDAARVLSDPNQLQQVLLNLVLNARDAMPAGGELVVAVSAVDVAHALAGADGPIMPGRWVRLTVQDSGTGMDEETRRAALEPFFTTKPSGRGTGLGLAIVHDIVRRSGAHLLLTSEPDKGTRFDIFFAPQESADAEPVTQMTHEGGRTILLVEDEPTLASLVSRLLEREGYVVRVASNAEDAMTIARLLDGELDLLLTDIVLPGRNGRELADAVQSLHPGLPTLYMSGHADDVIERTGIDAARTRILDKPFHPDDLYACVRESLGASPAQAVRR